MRPCPDDCGSCGPTCGDGLCEAGEDCGTCPDDCGGCGSLTCDWPDGWDPSAALCCWRTDAASWSSDWLAYEDQVLLLVNQQRLVGHDCGGSYGYYPPAPPLSMNSALVRAARRHSADQAIGNFVGHIGTDGSFPADRALEEGYTGTPSLENAGGGYGPWVDFAYGTPQSIVDGWMNSPGHCKTIMRANLFDDPGDPAIDEVGIGYVNMLRQYDPNDPSLIVSHRRWTLIIGASQSP